MKPTATTGAHTMTTYRIVYVPGRTHYRVEMLPPITAGGGAYLLPAPFLTRGEAEAAATAHLA